MVILIRNKNKTIPKKIIMPLWENIIWVYDQPEDKKLITADFRADSNLEKELNLTEECDTKIEGLEKKCEQKIKQLDATMVLLKLQWKIENHNQLNDIDLVYDEKLDAFRYRLFNQDDLTLAINLDNSPTHDKDMEMSQLEKMWEIIVELINNIDELEFEDDNQAAYKNYQEIASKGIVFNSHIVSSESLKDIFYFNPNEDYPGAQANEMFNKIKYTIQKAQEFKKDLEKANIEIK